MKRTWITVKRGILEPKHRFALGELVWLFLYILDITNWEEGVIEEWLDRGVAEEMEMPLATLVDQRRKLQDKGYITCERKQHGIRIIVHNWTNPREYTGKKYNEKIPINTPINTLVNTPINTLINTPEIETPSHEIVSSYSQKSKIKNQNTEEDHAQISPIQRMIEDVIHLMPANYNDIKAMEEMEKMNPLQEDIQSAYDWLVGQGKTVRYYSSLTECVRTAIAKRIGTKKPMTQHERNIEVLRKEMEEVMNGEQ
jgi:hypothetical protein